MLIVTFVSSFLIQYYIISYITANKLEDVTNNYGKVYKSLIMGISMVTVEVMSKDYYYGNLSVRWYIGLLVLNAIVIYMYKNQTAINDVQYLQEMIEQNSVSMLPTKQIIEKSDNFNVVKLAKVKLYQQEDEMRMMREVLDNIVKRGGK
jgi:uncharacterized protein (DUF305 family)